MTDFRSLRINRKKFSGSGTTPSYFPTLMNLAIFHNSEPRGRTNYNHAFYFEGFMMQQSDAKNDFYNTF